MATKNLSDLIKDLIGIDTVTRINPEVAAVGTTAAVILKQNPSRLAFVVVNLSTNELYISPSADVSSSKGIRLSPSGGSASFRYDQDFDMIAWEWSAVATGAASSILVLAIETGHEVK